MQLDAYQRCVGGADKKIKFCCGKDIVGDLNGIFDALNADQRASALEQVERAIAKYGEKDCLLATKISALIQLGESDSAKSLVDELLSRNPDNPVAMGQKTTLLALEDKVDESVACLQRALESYDRTISRGVLNAIRIVGALLQTHQRVTAARAHFILYNTLATEPDPEVANLLMATFSDPSLPVFLKHDPDLPTAPDESGWASTYNSVRALTFRGCWASSLVKFKELDEAHPNQPILRKAIAILEGRVGDDDSTSAAWHRYATTPGVDPIEAIEAEATTLVLRGDLLDDTNVQRKLVTMEIDDTSPVMEALSSHPRAAMLQQAVVQDPAQPPPKIAYYLLDRDQLQTLEGVTRDQIPNVIGTVMVYGRETDRVARLELEGWVGFGVEAATQLLRELLPNQIGSDGGETILGEQSLMELRMGVQWYLTQSPEPQVQRGWLRDQFLHFFRHEWPDLPLSRFDGKSARQAAADPANHVPLLAWLLWREEEVDTKEFDRLDLDEIRADLGLATRGMVDPSGVNLDRLPLCRFSRLEFAKMSEEQLERTIQISRIAGHEYALRTAAEVRLSRDVALDPRSRFDLLMIHAFLHPDLQQGLSDFEQLGQLAAAAEVQPSHLLLTQLDWALGRRLFDQAQEVAGKIQRDHLNEPGIAQRFTQMLVQYGLIDPRQARGGGPVAEPAPPAESGSRLWTGEGGESTDDPDTGSKLWVPGMD